MCGRYTLRGDTDEIAARFAVDELLMDPALRRPRYNIAPTQSVLAVLDQPEAREQPAHRVLTALRWGLVPSWAKDLSIGSRMLNARAETLAEKPSFRSALRRRRCLIPADGFYEWRRAGREKQPLFIALREGGLFAIAGLWEEWTPPGGGDAVRSCTLITVAPNALMAPIHDRMPAILRPEDEERWLAPETAQDAILSLLRPYQEGALAAHPVSRLVNSASHEGPACLSPPEQGLLGG